MIDEFLKVDNVNDDTLSERFLRASGDTNAALSPLSKGSTLFWSGKKIEDKEGKKENKKQIDKIGRKFKSLAKDEARFLASRLFPSISQKFIKKNTDGIAEAVLIS